MVLIKINYTSVSPIIKITYDETPVYVKTTFNNVYCKVAYTCPTTKYYGAFSDFTNQSAALVDTGYAVTINTTDLSNGVSIVDNSKITFAHNGIYDLQFSFQLSSEVTNGENDVTIWLKKNGVDMVGSASYIAVPRKTGGISGHSLPAWNFLLDINADDYIEFYWSTTNINVSLKTYSASYHPSIPSVIITATQI